MERKNIGTSSALEALIQGFYAKTNSLPTLEQCNDIRIQNGQRIIAASSFSKAISKWNREHSNAKTVGALIHELHAEMDCLPTTPSTYAKEIKKWNRQHASSQSEHAESMSSIGDEDSGTSSALEAFIRGFYAKTNSLPTLAQCNDVRLQNGQRTSTPSTYAKEIKKWNRQHASSQSEHAESSPKGWAT